MPVPRRRRYGVAPRRVRGALGDDADLGSTLAPAAPLSTADIQAQTLATLQGVRQDIADRLKREELQKWLQIAATISIPLMAWAWRTILGRRRSAKMEI